jgi:hypothetical protein
MQNNGVELAIRRGREGACTDSKRGQNIREYIAKIWPDKAKLMWGL